MSESSRHILDSFSLGLNYLSDDNIENFPNHTFLTPPQIRYKLELFQRQNSINKTDIVPIEDMTCPSFFRGH